MLQINRGLIGFFGLFILSFILTKRGRFRARADGVLADLIYYLFFPLYTADLLLKYSLPSEKSLFLKAFLLYGILLLLSVTIVSLFGFRQRESNVYQLVLPFSSWAFLGIPLVESTTGTGTLSVFLALNTPFFILVYLAPVLRLRKNPDVGDIIRLFPLAAILIVGALIRFGVLSGPSVTEITNAGRAIRPLSVVYLGALAATIPFREFFDYRLMILTLVKLVILPIFGYLISVIATGDPVLVQLITILLMLPVSPVLAAFAGEIGREQKEFCKIVLWTHLLSAITIPLLFKYLL